MSQENVEVVRGVRVALPPLSASARERRTVDERLFVRFPALYGVVSEGVTRLSPGSRIRRLMLTRVIQRGYAAGSRRDFEVLLTGLDPGVEFRPADGLWAVDLDAVVHGRVVHGRDGYREVWQRTLDSFEDLRLEPEEVLDLGDNKLLVTVQFWGHGPGGGVPVSQRVFQLLEVRHGLVARIEDFTDRAEALAAVGPSE